VQLELGKLPLDEAIDFDELVQQSSGFSGAEVVAFCNDSILDAIENNQDVVTMGNLLHALSKVKPQITVEMLEFYSKFK